MEQPRDDAGRYGHVRHPEPGFTLGAGTAGWPSGAYESYEWTGREDTFRASR